MCHTQSTFATSGAELEICLQPKIYRRHLWRDNHNFGTLTWPNISIFTPVKILVTDFSVTKNITHHIAGRNQDIHMID
jgi:hypothetical protein